MSDGHPDRTGPAADQRRGELGGFLRLSGLAPGQLYADNAFLARVVAYQRLVKMNSLVGTGIYAGFSIETGQAWYTGLTFSDLRFAGSAFLAADTTLGPLFVAVGLADGGYPQLLSLARPAAQLKTRPGGNRRIFWLNTLPQGGPMKKTTISVLALLLTLGLGTSLLATMEIQKEFKAKYPEAKAVNGKCSTCHMMALPEEGRRPRRTTPTASTVKATKKDGKYDFAAIEKKDSDGDGVSNIDEINKGTNPGDKAAK